MEVVLVIGAGVMGAGIAQVCAQSGYQVHLMDINEERLGKAQTKVKWLIKKLNKKGLIQEPTKAVMERISLVNTLESAGRVDWVIEATFLRENLKKKLFLDLDRLTPTETPLCTNASSIPISRIADRTVNPQRVIGFHFFKSAPLIKLVEVIKGEKTSDKVFERCVSFARTLGMTPVRVNKDIPGFVMSRIFSAAFSEAIDLVADGVASVEDVDAGMKLCYGWSAGPFEIVDNAGLDTYALIETFMKKMGEDKLVAHSDMLQQMVRSGNLGKKTGKGFYTYDPVGKRIDK